MKNILIISFLLLIGINGFGQENNEFDFNKGEKRKGKATKCDFRIEGLEQDTLLKDTNQLMFQLKVEKVIDLSSEKILTGVTIKIIGTDSSIKEFISDSLGVFPIIDLKANTSYTTIVSKNGYLVAKGKVTTVYQSKYHIHEYALQPIHVSFDPFMPIIQYNSNSIEPNNIEDIYNSFYKIMRENLEIAVRITGYRKKIEKKNISKKRVEHYSKKIIKMGLDKKRLELVDGGVFVDDVKEENYLKFKIISVTYPNKE